MDDDPEPNLDNVCGAKNEPVFHADEFQKFAPDSTEEDNSSEMTQHQESGDTGPFLEQDVLRRPKVAPDPGAQVDSKDGLFRRQEWLDQGQGSDGSVKSNSSTPPRKPPRRSLQRVAGQDSRRSSQQSAGQQSLLSQKPTRTLSGNEPGIKDGRLMSQQAGKVVKCRSQQASRTWERKPLSEVLCSSSEDSERAELTTTEDEFTSLWETNEAEEEAFRQELECRRQQLERKVFRPKSQPLESHSSSQQSIEQSSPLDQKTSQVQITKEMDTSRVSQKTGRAMTCQTQQTSFIWEPRSLADILCSSSQDSQFSREAETDGTDTEGTLASFGEMEDFQHLQKPKTELQSKRPLSKTDQFQQTDSTHSIRKTLLDRSQQTDISDDVSLCTPLQSQHGSQDSLRFGGENAPEVPNDPGSLQSMLEQKLPSAKKAPERKSMGTTMENLWISHKTGKVVRNQSQQTDKSWLQYHAAKMLKTKKCSSQQTDESFLLRYRSNKMKKGRARPSSAKPEKSRPGSCDSGFSAEDLKFVDLDGLSLESELVATIREQEYFTSEGEPGTELSQPAGSPNVLLLSSSPDQWTGEPESQATAGDTSSFMDGLDDFHQTYSVISVEDGIWMNRRTGRLLVSHGQQTSITSLPGSHAILGKWDDAEDTFRLPGARVGSIVTVKQAKRKEALQRRVQESDQDRDPDSNLIMVQPVGQDSELSDDMENMLSSRLSEAMLLSIDSPETEEESQEIYAVLSLQEGSFLNVKTGRQLLSQAQQTEEPFEHILRSLQTLQAVTVERPKTGQAKIPEKRSDDVQEFAEEGMDPMSKKKNEETPPKTQLREEPIQKNLLEDLPAPRATSEPPKKDQEKISVTSSDIVLEFAEEGKDSTSKKKNEETPPKTQQREKPFLEDLPAPRATSEEPPKKDQEKISVTSGDIVLEFAEEVIDPISKNNNEETPPKTQQGEEPFQPILPEETPPKTQQGEEPFQPILPVETPPKTQQSEEPFQPILPEETPPKTQQGKEPVQLILLEDLLVSKGTSEEPPKKDQEEISVTSGDIVLEFAEEIIEPTSKNKNEEIPPNNQQREEPFQVILPEDHPASRAVSMELPEHDQEDISESSCDNEQEFEEEGIDSTSKKPEETPPNTLPREEPFQPNLPEDHPASRAMSMELPEHDQEDISESSCDNEQEFAEEGIDSTSKKPEETPTNTPPREEPFQPILPEDHPASRAMSMELSEHDQEDISESSCDNEQEFAEEGIDSTSKKPEETPPNTPPREEPFQPILPEDHPASRAMSMELSEHDQEDISESSCDNEQEFAEEGTDSTSRKPEETPLKTEQREEPVQPIFPEETPLKTQQKEEPFQPILPEETSPQTQQGEELVQPILPEETPPKTQQKEEPFQPILPEETPLKTQQGEEPFQPILVEDPTASGAMSVEPSKKDQGEISVASIDDGQVCPEEGMDDDPMIKEEEDLPPKAQGEEQTQTTGAEVPVPKKEQVEISESSSEDVLVCPEEGMDDDPTRKKKDKELLPQTEDPLEQILQSLEASRALKLSKTEPSSDDVPKFAEEGLDPISKNRVKQLPPQAQPTEKGQEEIPEPFILVMLECREEGMDDDPRNQRQKRSTHPSKSEKQIPREGHKAHRAKKHPEHLPRKAQVIVPEPSFDEMQECPEEGMDDDPAIKDTQLPPKMEFLQQVVEQLHTSSSASVESPGQEDLSETTSSDDVKVCPEDGMDDDPVKKKKDKPLPLQRRPVQHKHVLREDLQASIAAAMQLPKKIRPRLPESSIEGVQWCPAHGMDDDPASRKAERQLLPHRREEPFWEDPKESRAAGAKPPKKTRPKISQPGIDDMQDCTAEGMDDDPTHKILALGESSADQ